MNLSILVLTPHLAYFTTIVYYTTIEAGLCVVAACLPTLGPLFSRDGRSQLRSGGRYRLRGSPNQYRRRTGDIRTIGSGIRGLDSGRGSNRRSEVPTNWFNDSSLVNSVSKGEQDDCELVGLETIAVATSTAAKGDHRNGNEEEDGIVVTTDISYQSFPMKPPSVLEKQEPSP